MGFGARLASFPINHSDNKSIPSIYVVVSVHAASFMVMGILCVFKTRKYEMIVAMTVDGFSPSSLWSQHCVLQFSDVAIDLPYLHKHFSRDLYC